MDGAAMFEDNLPTEAKTDAGTSGLGGVEGDKSVLQYVGWHTTSAVANEKPHPRPLSEERGELRFDLYLCGAAFVGILDEVDEDLLYLSAVGQQPHL